MFNSLLARGTVVGVVTVEAVAAAWPEQHVDTILDWEVVRVPRDADERRTLQLYRSAAWASLYRRAPR